MPARTLHSLLLPVAALLLVAGCGATPTATPRPPTMMPRLATSTPIAPTASAPTPTVATAGAGNSDQWPGVE